MKSRGLASNPFALRSCYRSAALKWRTAVRVRVERTNPDRPALEHPSNIKHTCVVQSIDMVGLITSIGDFVLTSSRRLPLQNNVYFEIPLPNQSYLELLQRESKRNVDAENRQLNKEWTETFLYVLPMGWMKPMCLICNGMVAVVKSSSVEIEALQNNVHDTV